MCGDSNITQTAKRVLHLSTREFPPLLCWRVYEWYDEVRIEKGSDFDSHPTFSLSTFVFLFMFFGAIFLKCFCVAAHAAYVYFTYWYCVSQCLCDLCDTPAFWFVDTWAVWSSKTMTTFSLWIRLRRLSYNMRKVIITVPYGITCMFYWLPGNRELFCSMCMCSLSSPGPFERGTLIKKL